MHFGKEQVKAEKQGGFSAWKGASKEDKLSRNRSVVEPGGIVHLWLCRLGYARFLERRGSFFRRQEGTSSATTSRPADQGDAGNRRAGAG